MHGSFASKGGIAMKRSVFTRQERIARLQSKGQWERGKHSIFHLPKVRTDI
ncbi:MAG: small basic protein [Planctomycetota bacterium]|nr:small basic protein [Planctomycetota bacterium]MCX8040572.1 small basic protein [Planctomycetota bacterium]